MVNYICPVFRIATQTFNGAIWWGTFGTLFKPENFVVSFIYVQHSLIFQSDV